VWNSRPDERMPMSARVRPNQLEMHQRVEPLPFRTPPPGAAVSFRDALPPHRPIMHRTATAPGSAPPTSRTRGSRRDRTNSQGERSTSINGASKDSQSSQWAHMFPIIKSPPIPAATAANVDAPTSPNRALTSSSPSSVSSSFNFAMAAAVHRLQPYLPTRLKLSPRSCRIDQMLAEMGVELSNQSLSPPMMSTARGSHNRWTSPIRGGKRARKKDHQRSATVAAAIVPLSPSHISSPHMISPHQQRNSHMRSRTQLSPRPLSLSPLHSPTHSPISGGELHSTSRTMLWTPSHAPPLAFSQSLDSARGMTHMPQRPEPPPASHPLDHVPPESLRKRRESSISEIEENDTEGDVDARPAESLTAAVAPSEQLQTPPPRDKACASTAATNSLNSSPFQQPHPPSHSPPSLQALPPTPTTLLHHHHASRRRHPSFHLAGGSRPGSRSQSRSRSNSIADSGQRSRSGSVDVAEPLALAPPLSSASPPPPQASMSSAPVSVHHTDSSSQEGDTVPSHVHHREYLSLHLSSPAIVRALIRPPSKKGGAQNDSSDDSQTESLQSRGISSNELVQLLLVPQELIDDARRNSRQPTDPTAGSADIASVVSQKYAEHLAQILHHLMQRAGPFAEAQLTSSSSMPHPPTLSSSGAGDEKLSSQLPFASIHDLCAFMRSEAILQARRKMGLETSSLAAETVTSAHTNVLEQRDAPSAHHIANADDITDAHGAIASCNAPPSPRPTDDVTTSAATADAIGPVVSFLSIAQVSHALFGSEAIETGATAKHGDGGLSTSPEQKHKQNHQHQWSRTEIEKAAGDAAYTIDEHTIAIIRDIVLHNSRSLHKDGSAVDSGNTQAVAPRRLPVTSSSVHSPYLLHSLRDLFQLTSRINPASRQYSSGQLTQLLESRPVLRPILEMLEQKPLLRRRCVILVEEIEELWKAAAKATVTVTTTGVADNDAHNGAGAASADVQAAHGERLLQILNDIASRIVDDHSRAATAATDDGGSPHSSWQSNSMDELIQKVRFVAENGPNQPHDAASRPMAIPAPATDAFSTGNGRRSGSLSLERPSFAAPAPLIVPAPSAPGSPSNAVGSGAATAQSGHATHPSIDVDASPISSPSVPLSSTSTTNSAASVHASPFMAVHGTTPSKILDMTAALPSPSSNITPKAILTSTSSPTPKPLSATSNPSATLASAATVAAASHATTTANTVVEIRSAIPSPIETSPPTVSPSAPVTIGVQPKPQPKQIDRPEKKKKALRLHDPGRASGPNVATAMGMGMMLSPIEEATSSPSVSVSTVNNRASRSGVDLNSKVGVTLTDGNAMQTHRIAVASTGSPTSVDAFSPPAPSSSPSLNSPIRSPASDIDIQESTERQGVECVLQPIRHNGEGVGQNESTLNSTSRVHGSPFATNIVPQPEPSRESPTSPSASASTSAPPKKHQVDEANSASEMEATAECGDSTNRATDNEPHKKELRVETTATNENSNDKRSADVGTKASMDKSDESKEHRREEISQSTTSSPLAAIASSATTQSAEQQSVAQMPATSRVAHSPASNKRTGTGVEADSDYDDRVESNMTMRKSPISPSPSPPPPPSTSTPAVHSHSDVITLDDVKAGTDRGNMHAVTHDGQHRATREAKASETMQKHDPTQREHIRAQPMDPGAHMEGRKPTKPTTLPAIEPATGKPDGRNSSASPTSSSPEEQQPSNVDVTQTSSGSHELQRAPQDGQQQDKGEEARKMGEVMKVTDDPKSDQKEIGVETSDTKSRKSEGKKQTNKRDTSSSIPTIPPLTPDTEFVLDIHAENLDRMHVFIKASPYLQVYECNRLEIDVAQLKGGGGGGGAGSAAGGVGSALNSTTAPKSVLSSKVSTKGQFFNSVYRSETHAHDLCPRFHRFILPSSLLCHGDLERLIMFRVWDDSRDGSQSKLVGETHTTMGDIIRALGGGSNTSDPTDVSTSDEQGHTAAPVAGVKLPLTRAEMIGKKGYEDSGQLIITGVGRYRKLDRLPGYECREQSDPKKSILEEPQPQASPRRRQTDRRSRGKTLGQDSVPMPSIDTGSVPPSPQPQGSPRERDGDHENFDRKREREKERRRKERRATRKKRNRTTTESTLSALPSADGQSPSTPPFASKSTPSFPSQPPTQPVATESDEIVRVPGVGHYLAQLSLSLKSLPKPSWFSMKDPNPFFVALVRRDCDMRWKKKIEEGMDGDESCGRDRGMHVANYDESETIHMHSAVASTAASDGVTGAMLGGDDEWTPVWTSEVKHTNLNPSFDAFIMDLSSATGGSSLMDTISNDNFKPASQQVKPPDWNMPIKIAVYFSSSTDKITKPELVGSCEVSVRQLLTGSRSKEDDQDDPSAGWINGIPQMKRGTSIGNDSPVGNFDTTLATTRPKLKRGRSRGRRSSLSMRTDIPLHKPASDGSMDTNATQGYLCIKNASLLESAFPVVTQSAQVEQVTKEPGGTRSNEMESLQLGDGLVIPTSIGSAVTSGPSSTAVSRRGSMNGGSGLVRTFSTLRSKEVGAVLVGASSSQAMAASSAHGAGARPSTADKNGGSGSGGSASGSRHASMDGSTMSVFLTTEKSRLSMSRR